MTDKTEEEPAEDPKEKQKISRRQTIRGFALLAAYLGFAEYITRGTIRHFYEDLIRGAIQTDAKTFSDYSSLKTCVHNGTAWVVVHHGFLDKVDSARWTNQTYDTAKYRNYMSQTYRLLQYLKQSGEPTILGIEDETFQESGARAAPTSACTLSVVTHNSGSEIRRFVHTTTGVLEQKIPLLKKALKDMGVHTINLAGELGYTKLLFERGACLYGMAKEFADTFEIRGVQGCIYPPNPPSSRDPIWDKLYYNQVPIPNGPRQAAQARPSKPHPTRALA